MTENVKKFSINDIRFVETEESDSYAVAEIWLLGASNNSHHNPISEEVLMKYGESAKGAWVVFDYSDYTKDATTHTNDQKIAGIIPHDSKIRFERNEKGVLFIVADAIISKIYNPEVWEMFKRNNYREVSCEFLANEEDELPSGDKPIISFDIKGVTILGSGIHASCPDAHMKMIQFAENKAIEYYEVHNNPLKQFAEKRREKMAEKETFVDPQSDEKMISKVDKVNEKLDLSDDNNEDKRKGKEMAEVKEKEFEDKDKKVTEPEKEVPKDKEFADNEPKESKDEKKTDEKETPKEKEEKEVEKPVKKYSLDVNADNGAMLAMLEKETVDNKELAQEVTNLWDELHKDKDLNVIMEKYAKVAKERDDLKKFKEEIMSEKTMAEFNKTMANVKEDMKSESYAKLYEEGKAIKDFDEMKEFSFKVKAFAYEESKAKESENEEDKKGKLFKFASGNNSNSEPKQNVFAKINNK